MSTIQENLTLLKNTKAGIKSAIEAKGVSDVGDTFSTYPEKIASIQTGTIIKNQDKSITANGSYSASSGYTGLGTVTVQVEAKLPYLSNISFGHTTFTDSKDLANFNLWLGEVLPQITVPGSKMFMDFEIPEDSTTKTLDVSGLNWKGLENGTFNCLGMFAQNNVEKVTLPSTLEASPYVTWNFQRAFYMYSGSSIENLAKEYKPSSMEYMFGFASNLTGVSLNLWDLSECSDTSFMFSNCTSLTSLGLSPQFFACTSSNVDYDFSGCENVTRIDVYNPQDGVFSWRKYLNRDDPAYKDFGLTQGNHTEATLTVPQIWLNGMQSTSYFTELSSKWKAIVASIES